MKMKKGFLVTVFSASLICQALGQTTVDNNELKIIPPSPTVAELGRYGLAGAPLSDGAFTTQIPLYEYKTKNLSLPITLQYSTNGLQVNKIAGRMGMDWTLSVGGSIGRMVLGKPDDKATWITYPAGFPNIPAIQLQGFLDGVDGFDTDPDIYNFNFNGYSGRFLYVSNSIIKLEQNSLDIQKTSRGFVVTDNNGIKYTFENQESSLTGSDCSGNPHSGFGNVTNAWLLTRIEHPLGDVITLSYIPVTYTYSSGVSQTYISDMKATDGFLCAASCPVMQTARQCISTTTNNGLLVDKISSNYNGIVQFIYADRTDLPGDQAVSGISVYSGQDEASNNLVHSINFDYVFPVAATSYPGAAGTNVDHRMFLQHLSVDDKNYRFSYNNLDQLPPRLSFSQDNFGFFNGKNNHSLIPQPDILADINIFQTNGYGDRSPDFSYAMKGLLNKITYPTGGTDEIVYEAHDIFNNGSYDCNALGSPIFISTPNTNSSLKSLTVGYSAPFTVQCEQDITVSVSCHPNDGGSTPVGEYITSVGFVSPPVPGDPPPAFVIALDKYFNQMTIGKNGDRQFIYHLLPGTYSLAVQVGGPSTGLASIYYQQAPYNNGNISIPGVRLKEVITSAVDALPLHRKFYYTKPGSVQSSGVAADATPVYRTMYTQIINCPGDGTLCSSRSCHYNEYSSNDRYSLYAYSGNHIYYEFVTEDLGNNFANGSIEHHFQVVPDASSLSVDGALVPGAPLMNYGLYNGFEYQTKYFKNNGGVLNLFRQIDRTRTDDGRLSSDGLYYSFTKDAGFGYSCPNQNATFINQYEGLHIAAYSLISRWLYPNSVTTTDYDDQGHSMITTVNTSYSNPVHQLATQTQTTNSKGETLTTNLYYPGDNTNPTDQQAVSAIQALSSKHMYNSLLEKQSLNGSSLLEDEQNYYDNTMISVPVMSKHLQAFMGGPLQERLAITSYAPNGAILGALRNTSDAEAYIWDYNQQYPVAEIRNAKSADVAYTSFEADGSGGVTINDPTRIQTNDGITGSHCYLLDVLSRSGMDPSSAYIISIWAKNGIPNYSGFNGSTQVVPNASSWTTGRTVNGWTYLEKKITGVTSVNISGGGGLVDEVRFFPADAQMTTYTYSPLVGVTSTCDVENRIAYYFYDGSGRLQVVKDQDGNVLKTYEYHYQQ